MNRESKYKVGQEVIFSHTFLGYGLVTITKIISMEGLNVLNNKIEKTVKFVYLCNNDYYFKEYELLEATPLSKALFVENV